MKKKLKLQTTIILLVCSVVLFSMLVTYLLIGVTVSQNAQSDIEEKAMIIARMVAQDPTVIAAMKGEIPEGEIQRYTEAIREVTGVHFVVVFNMEGIRKSHPDPAKIGQAFVGGDEENVLTGVEQISIAEGTLGMSLRAFTPLYSPTGEQIGAVSVGVSLDTVQDAVGAGRSIVYISIFLGTIVGIVGAIFLANRIKKILFGLEPSAIARVLEERNGMLHSMFEGVIAVDQNGAITIANSKARQMFQQANFKEDPVGKQVDNYLDNIQIKNVIDLGKTIYNVEANLNGYDLVVNGVPLCVDGEIVGAIATLRDKTEIKSLAEQLTGTRMYASALRAQTHEFMNKLQVILGMVHMKYFDELAPYINQITRHYQEEIGFISKRVKDPVLAGFILAKVSYAREQGIDFTLSKESFIPEPAHQDMTHEIVKILGNLIDNSFDALENSDEKLVEVHTAYNEQRQQLEIKVTDSGSGISEAEKELLFEKGFSTKQDDRGYGLFLIRQSVESLNGEMDISSIEGLGTSFQIILPFKCKGENE